MEIVKINQKLATQVGAKTTTASTISSQHSTIDIQKKTEETQAVKSSDSVGNSQKEAAESASSAVSATKKQTKLNFPKTEKGAKNKKISKSCENAIATPKILGKRERSIIAVKPKKAMFPYLCYVTE